MCEQQPVIQQDINKWNKNDFTMMERRLSRFIPLVRLYHISSEDFLLKIYPFKELLPNELVNNILTYHMVPNNKLNINMQLPRCAANDGSVIIRPQHLNIFANWIEKKEMLDYNKVNYRFKLLYRSSKDGNTIAAFHEKCDNKGPTIVIAKVTNSEQIIGGYNPLQWDSSSSHKSTNDSFLFLFTNRTNLQSAKVSYSNGKYSIYCGPNNGPSFGGAISLFNNRWGTWKSNSYPNIVMPQNLNVEDYEVFQVIK